LDADEPFLWFVDERARASPRSACSLAELL
jgi:hypothetical protein